LANRTQMYCGLPSPVPRYQGILVHAARSGLWLSSLKFRLLIVAICIRLFYLCQSPHRGWPQSTAYIWARSLANIEIQLPPCPLVWCFISFWHPTFQRVRLVLKFRFSCIVLGSLLSESFTVSISNDECLQLTIDTDWGILSYF
jgi:hypothetical protein